ncbi:MAG TPA: hypothetical protein VMH83_15895 [Candidatus Acidoferrum sp.]|nr:hypothetical protein [Candidatus Acidoferrum sp.]
MNVEWKFERKRRNQKTRDPMQASFFTNASIDSDTHALVREAIQNSLDAKCDRRSKAPVHVRFAIGTHKASDKVMARYISREAWQHFNADDNGLASPPRAEDDCRYIVYEDFNTKGLIGDEKAYEAQKENSFYYFMRAEGQSGKEDGERGRHGIGKYVFPYTSGIRMFIAATVRSTDMRCLIAGQSVLKSHHVDGQHFTPDGWWGRFEEDGEQDYFQLPIEEKNIFRQLKEDFGLIREADQSGLSLIIPYVQSEVEVDKLSEHVIREYFWPIVDGQLKVEICDAFETRIVDKETIQKNLAALVPEVQLKQFTSFVNLAVKALSGHDYLVVELNLPPTASMPKWDKDYLIKKTASSIQEALTKTNSFIRIKCPIYVQKSTDKAAAISSFDIYLSKDIADTARKPLFVREGITIPEDRVPQVRGYTSIVVIETGDLATLLGDSENPAHTEWEKNAIKFKGKYKWGPTTIDFVRLSVGKLLNLLSQSDEDEDPFVLSDIFYLNLPENEDEVPQSRKRKLQPNKGEEPEPPPTTIPPGSPRKYRLLKVQSGFVLAGAKTPIDQALRFKITVAYDFEGASKASALKKYHKNDFDLAKRKNINPLVMENLNILEIGGNTISFTANTNDFMLEVTGFDNRRDIIVDVDVEEIANEAI